MDLESAAHELYGLLPADFMDARKRLVTEARGAGDAALAKEIGALRKPTVSAWAVNLLPRQAIPELNQLLDVGTELRAAWSSGGSIGGLEQRRADVIALLVRTARTLADRAGQPLREPAVREVEDTLQAATVDPEVAVEVRAGNLSSPRSHAGFVPVGPLSPQSLARPPQPAPPRPAKRIDRAAQEEDRRRKAEDARQAADDATRSAAEWKSEIDKARERLAAATAEADGLKQQLDGALSQKSAAQRRLRIAEREHTRATRTADDARRRAEDLTRGSRS